MSDTYSAEDVYPSGLYTPDIEKLARGSQEVLDAYPDAKKITDTGKRVSTLKEQERAETEPSIDQQIQRLRGDTANIDTKYKAIAPVETPKWRPEEHPISSPLEAFGSYAGVFAMLASAITKQPVENTLNAGAAAINSVRDNDLAGYDRAYKAWDANTKLAFKLHDAQRQDYDDAIAKMKVNAIAGKEELSLVSRKWGDKITQTYLDAGMDDKALEFLDKRNKAMGEWVKVQPQIQKLGEQNYVNLLFQKRVKELNDERQERGQPKLNTRELYQLHGQVKDQYASSDEETVKTRELQDRAVEEGNARQAEGGKPPMTAEEEARKRGNVKALSTQTGGSVQKMDALATRDRADRYFKEAEEAGKPISWDESYTKASRDIGTEKAHVTGNQADRIRNHVNQLDESMRVIDRVEGTIEKYVGAAGLPARPLRMKERLSNIIGSNQSDRVQMQRDIEYLRLNAPRLLTDSPARPLAADIARINSIVAGLEWGDTGVNTLRAMEEIKGIYSRSRAAALSRLSGTWSPNEGGTAAPMATPSGGAARGRPAPWESDPVLK